MKLNIKPQNCQYIVDKEKRKVICIINNTANAFIDFLGYPWDTVLWPTKKGFSRTLLMPKRFVGIATCAAEDEWNEELGKFIAFSKAKHKFEASFFKRADTFINELDHETEQYLNRFNDYGEKLGYNIDNLNKKIEEMMDNK